MKRWLNRGLDALFAPGTERLWVRRLRGRVMVLVYHRVGEGGSPGFLDFGGVPRITPAALRRELSTLVGLGARFLTFRDLREGRFPASSEIGLVVSFDDGFRDSYERGLPVVESLGGKAVVFQCTAMLDGVSVLPEHRLYRLLFTGTLKRRSEMRTALASRLGMEAPQHLPGDILVDRALTAVPLVSLLEALDALESADADSMPPIDGLYPNAEMLRAADSAGHEIGSHGHWHLHRATIDAHRFEEELRVSKGVLADVLGQPPMAFSFPFGATAPGDERTCGKYYAQAATCEREFVSPHSPALALGRFSWPGPARNGLRERRWLLTGSI